MGWILFSFLISTVAGFLFWNEFKKTREDVINEGPSPQLTDNEISHYSNLIRVLGSVVLACITLYFLVRELIK
jgi:hypothetical protein